MQKLFVLSVLVYCCTALARSNITVMSNTAIGQFPSKSFPADGAAYWQMRDQAIDLAKNADWKNAVPLLEKLTAEYTDDGDTWFLLGHGYLQTGQYTKAIPALKRTLELGTILSGVESASAPSNDIMIKIAQCYSEAGDQSQALQWIKKALDHRWDERKDLISSTMFESICRDQGYKQLAGDFQDESLSRDQRWTADLEFLMEEIMRLHVNPFHYISKPEFLLQAKLIETDIPRLSDQQIVFRFMELLGSLGNGHNFIVPTHSLKGAFSRLPVQFYWFNDGIFIVGAETGYEYLIGRKVISVAGQPTEDLMRKIAAVNARDNEMQQYWLAPYYLALPEILEGLGIVSNGKEVSLALGNKDGVEKQVALTGRPFNFAGFPTLPALKGTENSAYLKNNNENYWLEYLPDNDVLYIQFNRVAQIESKPLEMFSREILTFTNQKQVQHVVLDLRHNSGGNGSIIPPLTRALIHFMEERETNKLFVIVGRNTFSAAHLLLSDLNRLTDAIIVGEPSGSKPNHLGEAGWFRLPYSGVWGVISSQYHQASKAEDHRIWVAPHVPVTLSSESYFSGKDPAMEQIIEIIKPPLL